MSASSQPELAHYKAQAKILLSQVMPTQGYPIHYNVPCTNSKQILNYCLQVFAPQQCVLLEP